MSVRNVSYIYVWTFEQHFLGIPTIHKLYLWVKVVNKLFCQSILLLPSEYKHFPNILFSCKTIYRTSGNSAYCSWFYYLRTVSKLMLTYISPFFVCSNRLIPTVKCETDQLHKCGPLKTQQKKKMFSLSTILCGTLLCGFITFEHAFVRIERKKIFFCYPFI